MRKLLVVVGTRPNFMKVTQFRRVAQEHGDFAVELVHTGQHTDARMSTVFFEQFGLVPDHLLEIPHGAGEDRIARIMLALDPVLRASKPTAVVVVGDVDSTLAAAIAANKAGFPLVHVEAGLRNWDKGMPEEMNRVLTDRIADHCLTTEASARLNLLKEGTAERDIHFVGNTMIDTIVAFEERIAASTVLADLGLGSGGHVLMTIHRPATVDDKEQLAELVDLIALVASDHRVVFPIHPRTVSNLEKHGLLLRLRALPGLVLCEPLGYFAFQRLIATSAFAITDSGGIQEETTYRRIPCLTLRPSTERPVTIMEGTNELITFDHDELRGAIARIRNGSFKKGTVPQLWDGRATERVFEVLNNVL